MFIKILTVFIKILTVFIKILTLFIKILTVFIKILTVFIKILTLFICNVVVRLRLHCEQELVNLKDSSNACLWPGSFGTHRHPLRRFCSLVTYFYWMQFILITSHLLLLDAVHSVHYKSPTSTGCSSFCSLVTYFYWMQFILITSHLLLLDAVHSDH